MRYTKYNFHKHTFCIFKEVLFSEIENLKATYTSKSGSVYYFTENGVYRIANHWGRAANCRWRLEPLSTEKNASKFKVGYANWSDFMPNNDFDNLFYIHVDWNTKEVTFLHRDNPLYQKEFLLRNALATAKRIKSIKEVLLENKWARHMDLEDIEATRKDIIYALLTSNDSLLQIKQKFN